MPVLSKKTHVVPVFTEHPGWQELRGRTRSQDATGPTRGAPSSISKGKALFYALALGFTKLLL